MKQLKLPLPIPEGYELVFRPWITLKNGVRLYASQVGKRAFPLVVPVKKQSFAQRSLTLGADGTIRRRIYCSSLLTVR